MRADIVAGAVFPDYELIDHTGKRRKLSDLQGPDAMILVLSRGGSCPKDRRQAEGLVQLHHEMEVGYCRLVTISTDNMLLTNEYRDGVGAHWTFLCDPARKVQKDLDIAEYTDPEHNPMIPHVIVLEPGLVIFKIYNGYWFFGRPTIEELRQDLRVVLKKCHPDWDISKPELGIMIAHNPLHGSGQAALPHPALALGENAHATQRIGITDGRQRQPAMDVTPHAVPQDAGTLAAPRQRAIPETSHLEPKENQRPLIHGLVGIRFVPEINYDVVGQCSRPSTRASSLRRSCVRRRTAHRLRLKDLWRMSLRLRITETLSPPKP